ncbi:MAG TPA: hypothetical protein VLB09_02840 [Nitrospiria bacterium]|nr:hypothetical protein [Nitrospiria bacterium]
MEKPEKNFVIYAHSGTYDKLHQVSTIALTAAAMGNQVYIFLFFWALKKFYSGTLDENDFPVEYQSWSHKITQLMKEKKVPPVSEMLKEARSMGAKVIVCSAGLEYMDIPKNPPEGFEGFIDDVWGLPQVLTITESAETVLYI